MARTPCRARIATIAETLTAATARTDPDRRLREDLGESGQHHQGNHTEYGIADAIEACSPERSDAKAAGNPAV